jgi:hypothetical protein
MKTVYRFVKNRPGVFLPVALALFVVCIVRDRGPVAEVAGVCSGLILGTLAHHHWLSAEIEAERHNEREATIERIEGFKRLGLQCVTSARDAEGWDFFGRVKRLQPKRNIALVGITARFLAEEKPQEMRKLLTEYPKLRIQVCRLDADSPHAEAKSRETGRPTIDNINRSARAWASLAAAFPGRVEVRKSRAIHCVEIEGYDFNLEEKRSSTPAYLYLIPVPFRADTNTSPSFLIEGPKTVLFDFWADKVRQLWCDAELDHPRTEATASA